MTLTATAPVKPVVTEPVRPLKPVVVIPKPEDEEPSRVRSVPVWTIVAGGAALAATGAGIGLWLASESAYDEFSSRDPEPTDERRDELKDKISGLDTGATISFAVAGALAVSAVVLFILVDRPAMKEKRATVSMGPGGFAFSFDF